MLGPELQICPDPSHYHEYKPYWTCTDCLLAAGSHCLICIRGGLQPCSVQAQAWCSCLSKEA